MGVVAVALLLGAGGCSQDPNSVAAQAKAGDQKGYVSGDGAVEAIPASRRAAPVELAGTLLDGTSWDAASARGKVLVLACLDNLVKGASGVAVQNFNLMTGHPETTAIY